MDDWVVVVEVPSPRVVNAQWFGAAVVMARSLYQDAAQWSEVRLVAEHSLRLRIEDLMRRSGYIPIGDAQIMVTEDLTTAATEYRMRVRGIENTSPVWVLVREAVAEDQAWLARTGAH